MVAESKRKANNKWDKENTRVFSIKLTKSNFEYFDKFDLVFGSNKVEKLKNLINFWLENHKENAKRELNK